MSVISPVRLRRQVTQAASEQEIHSFISEAPDAAPARKSKPAAPARVKNGHKLKGNKVIITVSIDPDLLDRLNEASAELGITRTAMINMLIRRELDPNWKKPRKTAF